jgi:hypothetical protein
MKSARPSRPSSATLVAGGVVEIVVLLEEDAATFSLPYSLPEE